MFENIFKKLSHDIFEHFTSKFNVCWKINFCSFFISILVMIPIDHLLLKSMCFLFSAVGLVIIDVILTKMINIHVGHQFVV